MEVGTVVLGGSHGHSIQTYSKLGTGSRDTRKITIHTVHTLW
jgi:hypothetical protein